MTEGRVNKIVKTEAQGREATLKMRPMTGSWSLTERRGHSRGNRVRPLALSPTCIVWTLALDLALCPESCFSCLCRRGCEHWS